MVLLLLLLLLLLCLFLWILWLLPRRVLCFCFVDTDLFLLVVELSR